MASVCTSGDEFSLNLQKIFRYVAHGSLWVGDECGKSDSSLLHDTFLYNMDLSTER
jgi:hypothetical protein